MDLGACTDLRHLDLRGCEAVAAVLGPSTGFPRLLILNLDSCRSFSELSQLGACPRLRQLRCGHSAVADLAPARGFPQLEELHAPSCAISSLEALAACPQLQLLDVSSSPVADLGPLAQCAHLSSLNLRGCVGVTSLAALGACIQLRRLDVSDCAILDVRSVLHVGVLLYGSYYSSPDRYGGKGGEDNGEGSEGLFY